MIAGQSLLLAKLSVIGFRAGVLKKLSIIELFESRVKGLGIALILLGRNGLAGKRVYEVGAAAVLLKSVGNYIAAGKNLKKIFWTPAATR